MVDVHDIGFTKLPPASKQGQDKEPHLNIVFIHGLNGHPRKTWEAQVENDNDTSTQTPKRKRTLRSRLRSKLSKSVASDQPPKSTTSTRVFWPLDFLLEDIPETRIWTYGYNADTVAGVFKANNKNSVSQHGQTFAARVECDINNQDPIIFVAHSLGGIILKDAMRRSPICRSKTKLIIFLGTPHRGSAVAGWTGIASNFSRLALQDPNKKVPEALEVNSEVLDNIHEEFKPIPQEYGIKIHSFQEARPISGIQGFQNKIVDDFSSKLDLPRQFETVESIDADHRQMVKCRSKGDMQYRAIHSVLQQFIRNEAIRKSEIKKSQDYAEAEEKRAVTSNANKSSSVEKFDGDSISEDELVNLIGRASLKNQARAANHNNGQTNNYERSSWSNKPSRVRCFRCDTFGHRLEQCFASENTVLRGRDERGRTGRCFNCGSKMHYYEECGFPDLLL